MSIKVLKALIALILLSASISLAQAQQPSAPPAVQYAAETALCTGVQDRMPVGEAQDFPADVGKVYLWCKVSGATAGETVIHHVWLRDGKETADVELSLKGSPWRTWSCKTIPPEWAGDWEVKVVGPDGGVIKSIPFTVGKQAKPVQSEGQ